MILTVTMNPSIDISYPLAHLKIDDVNRIKDVQKTAGGKGLNVSRVIRQLGAELTATGLIGGHFGQFIEARLTDDNIRHDFYRIDQESRECIAILHDGGNQTEILEAGPTITDAEATTFLKHYQNLLEAVDLVTISGSLPAGLPTDFYTTMIHLAHKMDKKVLLDTSGVTLRTALSATEKPDLVKPNEEELQQLLNTKIDVQNLESLQQALSNPIFKGVEWICVSLGKHGAFAKHGDNFYAVKIPTIKVVNPVGSGDSTLAGLAVAIATDKSDIDILKTAMTSGMLNAMEKKTGYIDPQKFTMYFKQVMVNQL